MFNVCEREEKKNEIKMIVCTCVLERVRLLLPFVLLYVAGTFVCINIFFFRYLCVKEIWLRYRHWLRSHTFSFMFCRIFPFYFSLGVRSLSLLVLRRMLSVLNHKQQNAVYFYLLRFSLTLSLSHCIDALHNFLSDKLRERTNECVQ